MFTLSKTKVHTAVAIGLAAMGIGASSASAAPAQFTAPGINHLLLPAGTVSISWGAGGPGQSRTCSNTGGNAVVSNPAGQGTMTDIVWNPTCTDGNGKAYPMSWNLSAPMLAQKNSGVFSLTSNGPINAHDTGGSPTPRITALPTPTPYTAAWQNAIPAFFSTLTFSNTAIANVYDNVTQTTTLLRITGTFNVGWGQNYHLI